MRNIWFIFISFLLFSFSGINYIHKYEKKIFREIKKTFNLEEISISHYKLPDHLDLGADNAFYQVKSNDEFKGYININRVNACRSGGCDKISPLSVRQYDHFYYMAVFDRNLSVLKVKILDYQSEHGYEICSKGWLKQFIGTSDITYEYNKNIDAISGATVSVNAIIDEMNSLTSLLNNSDL